MKALVTLSALTEHNKFGVWILILPIIYHFSRLVRNQVICPLPISSSKESDQQHDWASLSNSIVNSEVMEGTSASIDNKLNRKLRPCRRCTVQGCGNRVVQEGYVYLTGPRESRVDLRAA
jgi:hypothetical protein